MRASVALRRRTCGLCLGALVIVVLAAAGGDPTPTQPKAEHGRVLSITLAIRSRPAVPTHDSGPTLEVCDNEGEPPYVGTDPFKALASLPPAQIVRPSKHTRSISITVLTGVPDAEFDLVVNEMASPIRALGTFRSDQHGATLASWDMRDSLGARVRRGVYQVTARRDGFYDYKFVVVE